MSEISTVHRVEDDRQITTKRVEIDGETHAFEAVDVADPGAGGTYDYAGDGAPPAEAVAALEGHLEAGELDEDVEVTSEGGELEGETDG